MITFLLAIGTLCIGYLVYSRVIERLYGVDDTRETPAIRLRDGVDYVPMSPWRIFLIQFLNIAGLGPIFGAIAGAMWGPVAFLWIVFGTILAGGVHDYFSGMLSMRHDGENIAEVVGRYMGIGFKQFMRGFAVLLLLLVGVVFVTGPAHLLEGLTPDTLSFSFWLYAIFIYYMLATLLPIDKLIGRIYPLFGAALLVMAIGIMYMLLFGGYPLPELTGQTLANMHTDAGRFPVFPMLFITVACGAISGFHSTQSPLMARCITRSSLGRKIFFGAMVAEGMVALVWAAAAMAFFGGVDGLNGAMIAHQGNAAWAVNSISNGLLGHIGGILALLGVVACPITSGDTAFRSARLAIADMLRLKQSRISRRLLVSVPLFLVGFALSQINFAVIWRYFAWSNQTLATIVLWAAAMFMARQRKFHWIASLPATFMTAVCVTYILIAPEGLSLPAGFAYPAGLVTALGAFTVFLGISYLRRPTPQAAD